MPKKKVKIAAKREHKPQPKKLPPPALDRLQRYTIAESNAILRQSNAKTYEQIKTGELRVIRDGGRTYVPGSELVRRSSLPDGTA